MNQRSIFNAPTSSGRTWFATPLQSVLTLVFAGLFAYGLWRFLDWGVLNATWVASERAECRVEGACWGIVTARIDQFLFGFYPEGERWRPALALALPAALFLLISIKSLARWRMLAGVALLVLPVINLFLFAGGGLGLSSVDAERWGGLSLTWLIASTSFVASLPFALLLAMGRRSDLPVLRILCTLFIELWRGVPLVAILFLAIILLPLILPPGAALGRFEMALIALTVYNAAYLAEVMRAGLQAIPLGQVRAARAIGFGYWRTQRYILLPQALGKVLPGVVNTAIALVKDTSYVMVVGLFDFVNIVNASLSDPKWLGSSTEAYLFVGVVYWAVCFGLSKWAGRFEQQSAAARGLARR